MAGKADVQAGGAFVRLFLKDEMTKQLGKSLSTAGKNLSIAGAAIVAPLIASAKSFANFGDQLDKMSGRTGIAAGELAAYGFAAEQSGSSLDEFENNIRRAQRSIGDLANGSGAMVDAFGQLGLTLADLQGLSPDKQFDLIAERIAAIEDPTMRAAAATKLFGRSGTSMLPMLENLRALKQEARDLGIVPDEAEVKRAAELTDAFNRMKRVVGAIMFNAGAALADDIEKGLLKVQQVARSTAEWVAAEVGA